MFKFLKKDSFILGISLGLLLPIVLYILLHYLAIAIKGEIFAEIIDSSVQLVSIFLNLFTLRYYLLKAKYDKTGRGILLATFVLALVYFFLFLKFH